MKVIALIVGMTLLYGSALGTINRTDRDQDRTDRIQNSLLRELLTAPPALPDPGPDPLEAPRIRA